MHPWLPKTTLLLAAAVTLGACTAGSAIKPLPSAVAGQLAALDVAWDTPGGEMASMPIGNGDLTSNVWVESNGDLVFYLGKSDAWDEISNLLKIGRVRVSFTPVLPTKNFSQRLDLRTGTVVITAGEGADRVSVRVWVDANHPVLRVEQEGGAARACKATVELWRTRDQPLANIPRTYTEEHLLESGAKFMRLGDTVVAPKPGENQLLWCHRDTASLYPFLLKLEHLEALAAKHPDPLLNRTFGAVGFGAGMKTAAPLTLESETPAAKRSLSFAVLTAQTPTLGDWTTKAKSLAADMEKLPLAESRAAHEAWWESFWNRSHLFVSGAKDAETVTRGYTLQRYMIGASSRGKYPPKFNGGAFTVNMTGNPDYRLWGGSAYWNQNNRWLCWPSLASGDYDTMLPFLRMYRDALPFRRDVTRAYYGHAGAFFNETFHFWGGQTGECFGWHNPTTTAQNIFVRWHWQGGLEVSAMMLDYYAHTGDEAFAKDTLLPVADAVVTFYDQHWKRDPAGKIRLDPTAALETFDAVNDLPSVAGLHHVLPRLLALPARLTTPAQRAAWRKTLADLPPVPTVTVGDKTLLAPGEKYWGTRNCENPALYALFPYRLHGVGRPGLQVAKDSFLNRPNTLQCCWSSDCVDAANLGLAGQARGLTVGKFSAPSAPQRFPAFWNPGLHFDWTPDMDHGGSAAMALGEMLMQCPGDRIILLPAWPRDWKADFKLHAPQNTVVEGRVEGGRVLDLKVTPETRRKDVIIHEAPPVSLTYGKTCAASSQWSGAYAAGLAVDGGADTRWSAAPGQTTGWLEVDLGKPMDVSRAVIDEGNWNIARKFALQYLDGAQWKTLATGTALGPRKEFKFTPVTAQKFRLDIQEGSGVSPTIREFELWK